MTSILILYSHYIIRPLIMCVDSHRRAKGGETVLHWACQSQRMNKELLKVLLDKWVVDICSTHLYKWCHHCGHCICAFAAQLCHISKGFFGELKSSLWRRWSDEVAEGFFWRHERPCSCTLTLLRKKKVSGSPLQFSYWSFVFHLLYVFQSCVCSRISA